jgi:hypothetical protein
MVGLRRLSVAVLGFGLAATGSSIAFQAGNQDRVVPGGGITAAGWKGVIDAASARQGRNINDSKLSLEGGSLKLAVGPAAVYWNPANTATGDYTVKASFTEPTYMSVNDHPHPYGPFIGGNKMGEPGMTLLYCATYGDGTFIMRGFGNGTPKEFRMGGRQPAAHPAVHKAAGVGKPVTQEISLSVKGDQVSCAVNGTVVASYPKAELVAPGKLDSLDGIYGIRVSHNLDLEVKGFGKS